MDKHLSDKLISAYLDDLTSRDEAEFVRRHAAECAQCADRLAQFNLLEETVAEMDPQAIQAEDTVLQQVRDRVLRRVSREQRAPREAPFGWWLNVFSVKSLAYAGIGVLLAGFAVFYIDYPSDAVRRNASGKGEIAKTESVEKGASHAASAEQLELYRTAGGFLSSVAKKAYSSASEEAESWKQESQSVLGGKLAALTEKSSGLLASAKSTASEVSETVENHGSRAMNAAAKQALPQAGIAAGTTLIQLLDTFS